VNSEELVERARGLAPLLAEEAGNAEALRQPVDSVIDAMAEARIFDLMVPRCYGGLELDLDTFLEVGLALGEGDASMAWVATFYIEHNFLLCQFPESFQRKLYGELGSRRHVLAPGMVAPSGRAEPVDGGYRLSGRWQWATGVMHSSWVIAGALSNDASGSIDSRFFALPIEDIRVEDTWFVDGMCGTGSNDVVIEDAFVPVERTVSLLELGAGTGPGSVVHDIPLYRTPMVPVLVLAATLPAVGQARAAVKRFSQHLSERALYLSATKRAEKAASQMRLARAEISIQQAELLLRDVVADVMETREKADILQRTRWMASYGTVVHQCRDIVQDIALASGASAHFRDHPLQRAVRDLNTLTCHVAFTLDDSLQNHGRALLGMEVASPLL
jgi:alkylation response protein AidB-like acyl-CoA dehydrogenase